jgi:hypothetical protein
MENIFVFAKLVCYFGYAIQNETNTWYCNINKNSKSHGKNNVYLGTKNYSLPYWNYFFALNQQNWIH